MSGRGITLSRRVRALETQRELVRPTRCEVCGELNTPKRRFLLEWINSWICQDPMGNRAPCAVCGMPQVWSASAERPTP